MSARALAAQPEPLVGEGEAMGGSRQMGARSADYIVETPRGRCFLSRSVRKQLAEMSSSGGRMTVEYDDGTLHLSKTASYGRDAARGATRVGKVVGMGSLAVFGTLMGYQVFHETITVLNNYLSPGTSVGSFHNIVPQVSNGCARQLPCV